MLHLYIPQYCRQVRLVTATGFEKCENGIEMTEGKILKKEAFVEAVAGTWDICSDNISRGVSTKRLHREIVADILITIREMGFVCDLYYWYDIWSQSASSRMRITRPSWTEYWVCQRSIP